MLFIKSLFFFAVAVSSAAISYDVLDESVASLARRDSNSAQTKSDMETILKNINDLTKATDMYNGSPISAFPIVSKHDALLRSIRKATAHAKDIHVPTEGDSAAIISYIQGSMWPAMGRTLSSIKTKKDILASAGQAEAMKSILENLEFVMLKLSNALVDATPLSKTIWALSVSKDMEKAFEDTIAFYGN
ncbi:hypothetical protein E4U09_002511 [Claviceps aff. purpurea]|uniref:Hydrophobic surface binding protein A-domain-containing protein n=1 Tax=Claviceps aff. purpurea TaxID=1967640 RepID=A0A9P7U1N9_9HYPO|nr:hypothetical protein E4U09_002511 [Claviceps aff. purpurea]